MCAKNCLAFRICICHIFSRKHTNGNSTFKHKRSCNGFIYTWFSILFFNSVLLFTFSQFYAIFFSLRKDRDIKEIIVLVSVFMASDQNKNEIFEQKKKLCEVKYICNIK